MRVALVHDWLLGMRGGEKCLEIFCELFPDAELYTLISDAEKISSTIRRMKINNSWLSRFPRIKSHYRNFLPLFPAAIESIDLSNYDLILSSSHCVAKGIFPHRALHVAYVHAPMRYVWDMYDAYFSRRNLMARTAMTVCRPYLQRWDVRSAGRVDYFIANSLNVAAKIRRLYARPATVLYPPVDLSKFRISNEQGPYYLVVSALVPYKRIDIVIEAFNRLKLPLKIAGQGPLRKQLERASGPNIEFLGWVSDEKLVQLYASSQALIFPGEEDFGIVPLEAQASGRPVIAYGKGGVLETVIALDSSADPPNRQTAPTGILFPEQSSECLITAIERFDRARKAFDPAKLRLHAAGFSRERFKAQVKEFVDKRFDQRRERA